MVNGVKAASFDGAIAFARELIRIPSLPGEEGELTRRVVAEMEALGYDEVWTDELGSVIGVVKGEGGGGSVMLSAHLDMVAAGDPAEWEYPPFDGVIAGGCLHGRGAMDIKGPLALQVHVAAALKGGVGGGHHRRAPGVRGAGGVGDGPPCAHRWRAPARCGDHRRVDAGRHRDRPPRPRRGRDRRARPGRPRRRRRTAPETLSISSLRSWSASVTSRRVRTAIRSWAVRPSWPPASTPSPRSLNVIPDRVTVTLDWRILPEDTEESLLARVRESLQPHLDRVDATTWPGAAESVQVRTATELQRAYTGAEEARRIFSPGFLMDAADPIVTAAARAVGSRNGNGAPARVRPWTFATDGGWTCGVRGIPTIGFAPGEERYAHTNTERLDLEEARWGYGRYLELVPGGAGGGQSRSFIGVVPVPGLLTSPRPASPATGTTPSK